MAREAGAEHRSHAHGRAVNTRRKNAPGGPAGRYLVNDAGQAAWLVHPGINGQFNTRPDGTTVHKFDAPEAKRMSYLIAGILDRHLPWGLVLFGVMIAGGAAHGTATAGYLLRIASRLQGPAPAAAKYSQTKQ